MMCLSAEPPKPNSSQNPYQFASSLHRALAVIVETIPLRTWLLRRREFDRKGVAPRTSTRSAIYRPHCFPNHGELMSPTLSRNRQSCSPSKASPQGCETRVIPTRRRQCQRCR